MKNSSVSRFVIGAYQAIGRFAGPLATLHLRSRAGRGREDPARIAERFGTASAARPAGSLLWFHAASVGESLSTLALIERIVAERPKLGILVTTGTVTSARLMAERLPDGAIHQYNPIDLIGSVQAFLDHWRPDLAVFVESELWPMLLTETRRRAIPTLLLNARLSKRSARGWRLLRPLIADLLGGFELVLAQSPQDRDRLAGLGASNVQCFGNLKSAAPAPDANPTELAALTERLGERARWLAASTHPGEETIITAAQERVRKSHPEALCLIVPRHPMRGREIYRTLSRARHSVGLLSRSDLPEPNQEFYIADSLGDLGLWFRLSPVVFVGGSLLPIGGHNLLEPAKLGCALLTGPETSNFAEIAKGMRQHGALEMVVSHVDLGDQVSDLLSNPQRRAEMGRQALAFAEAQADVLDRVLEALTPYLDEICPPPNPKPEANRGDGQSDGVLKGS